MMTSRSEYRLLLRQDNADERLVPIGVRVGLNSPERGEKVRKKYEAVQAEIDRTASVGVAPSDKLNGFLAGKNSTPLKAGCKLIDLLRRPELSYADLAMFDPKRPELPAVIREQVEIRVKYAGYIERQMRDVEQYRKLQSRPLPLDLDYNEVDSLRLEARQKLNAVKPLNFGQAARISGVSPADITALMIYIETHKKGGKGMTERELLTAGLRELGVAECPSAADNLQRYSEILREKNKVMNLTAITDPTEIVTRHFLDCAALAPYMPQDGRVLDVGTGAGFPGMPLAILCPQTEFVLLDALRKRIDFLNEVITELGLTNVTAVHARAEDYARDNRGTFDLAVSRAVADLRVLSELALPMVKVGGAFLAMKAEDCTEEVETAANARMVLGAPDAEVLHYTVPFDEVSRAIVRLQKTQETPEKYPRRFKKIQTSPL